MTIKASKTVIRIVFTDTVSEFLEDQSELYGCKPTQSVIRLMSTHPDFREFVKIRQARKEKIESAKIEALRKSQLSRIKLPEDLEAERLKEIKRIAREEAERLREERRLMREHKAEQAEKLRAEKDLKKRQKEWAAKANKYALDFNKEYPHPRPEK